MAMAAAAARPQPMPMVGAAVGDPNVEADDEDERNDEDEDLDGFDEGDATEELLELVRSKSNIERIDNAAQKYHKKALDLINRLQLAQDPDLIERDTLKMVVQLHQSRFYGCLSLPFSLAFFGFFALSAYLHEDITNVYMIESGLRKVLGHNLDVVDDIPQLWQWMRFDTLVPELFDQGKPTLKHETMTGKTFWSRVLTFNQLQGPLLLEQSRSEKEFCVDDIVKDLICYPQTSRSTATFGRNVNVNIATPAAGEYAGGTVTLAEREAYYRSSFSPVSQSRRLRSMRTEYMNYLPGGAEDEDDMFRAFIYPNTPRQLIDEHFKYLYDKGWLDIQSKQLSLKALLLNAEVGRPRLEQYQVIFGFSRGGGVFARMTLESLFLEFAADNVSLGTDFMFVMCLITMTLLEFKTVWQNIKQKICRKALGKFWTLLQWTIIVLGWAIVLGYLRQQQLRADVVTKLKSVIATQKADIPAEQNTFGQELFEASDVMVNFSGWFRLLLADYHLILMFRFFAAFRAQPRLGVVTSTLEASVVDIVHFLVVLLPTFMAYAISGCFIFGRRMETFATFDGAIGICFKMAMEGEYDWPELSTEHYWTAALWTWTFMLLMVLLMLNMVLAIVMDVYTEMRKNAGQSETVFVTIRNLVYRIYNWRRWVKHTEFLEKLPYMNFNIRRADVVEQFPNIPDRQLNALIYACKRESMGTHDSEHQNTMRMTMASKLAIDQIHEEIDQLYEAYDAATRPETDTVPTIDRDEPVKGWLHHIAKQMAAQNHFMLTAQWQLQQLQWKWQTIEAMHGVDVRFDNLPPLAANADCHEPEPL